MHHFFVDPSSIEEGIVRIVGTDLNHMKNVLRMKPGEESAMAQEKIITAR